MAYRKQEESKALKRQLAREQARAGVMLDSISDAVIGTDLDGNVDYLNAAAERLTGWTRADARGIPAAAIFRIVDSNQLPQPDLIAKVLGSGQPLSLANGMLLQRRDGSAIPVEDSISPVRGPDGVLRGAVLVFHDVSAAREMNARMLHQAQHDFLTMLPNRSLLRDRIGRAIPLARRSGNMLSLFFLDLDNFKYVNDSLGHAIGDRLLQSVSQRLRDCVRDSDTVSRQGGDEFVVLLEQDQSEADAIVVADKMLQAIAEPHLIDQHELHISTSIGISRFPTDGSDADTLIKNADTAMYHAKERGRNTYQFFNIGMNLRAVERQSIEAGLRQALQRNEFVLHFQPKITLDSGCIAGVEALLRWRHAQWGMTAPLRFVKIAEESGLIVPIGRWVLREACMQAGRWRADGINVSLAVNISALEFRQRDFYDNLCATLQETGMPAHLLQLEITESVLMRDVDCSARTLQRLNTSGIQIAVDDFGTGYSSLSYLRKFPIDVLKIDQSFVHDIDACAGNGIIAGAVIGMANNLGLRVVAEGVESSAQLAFLRARNCQEGQGYYFSRPLDAGKLETLLLKDAGCQP